jgi:hypothetical protein
MLDRSEYEQMESIQRTLGASGKRRLHSARASDGVTLTVISWMIILSRLLMLPQT